MNKWVKAKEIPFPVSTEVECVPKFPPFRVYRGWVAVVPDGSHQLFDYKTHKFLRLSTFSKWRLLKKPGEK